MAKVRYVTRGIITRKISESLQLISNDIMRLPMNSIGALTNILRRIITNC